jgi:heat shock protein HtpX
MVKRTRVSSRISVQGEGKNMFKRIGLFFIVNFLVMITISIVVSITGLNRYIGAYGINLPMLLGFCLIWGMGGSFISLLMSKMIAKWSMGVQVVDPSNPGSYAHLVESIQKLSSRANIPMPEVGVYNSPELNAFATGPSKSNSLVAVSTGLLNSMNRDELDGVLGHEITHISNGDMVTMTLIMGIVNAFSMFLSRIISFLVGRAIGGRNENIVRMILTFVLDIVFSILGTIVVAFFSRRREFRADLGGGHLAGKQNMIAALQSLQRKFEPVDERGASIAALKISGKKGWMSLFSTHPPLEKRIEALRNTPM